MHTYFTYEGFEMMVNLLHFYRRTTRNAGTPRAPRATESTTNRAIQGCHARRPARRASPATLTRKDCRTFVEQNAGAAGLTWATRLDPESLRDKR